MDIIDLLNETYSALKSNKTRTFLNALGIIIGIASVIVIMALGEGAKLDMEKSFGGAGATTLTVSKNYEMESSSSLPSGSVKPERSITMKDYNELKDLPGVKDIVPTIETYEQITSAYGQTISGMIVAGMDNYMDAYNMEIYKGGYFSESQIDSGKKVVVIGAGVYKKLFDKEDAIGEKIRIGGNEFIVTGVIKPFGDSFGGRDLTCIIPFSTMKQVFRGDGVLENITVFASSREEMGSVKKNIMDRLRAFRHQNEGEEDFRVDTRDDMLKESKKMILKFTLFLSAIAGISLFVGGIGIMNMMLTTVTERTREIGLRKAIGAKKKDIVMQFVIESVLLTSVGGVLGVLLGCGLSFVISEFAPIKPQISIIPILVAFSVCSFIGVLFGYYPAKKASKLKPIEALRYE